MMSKSAGSSGEQNVAYSSSTRSGFVVFTVVVGTIAVSHGAVSSIEMTRLGVHTGLQHTTVDDLRALWLRIEDLGFDWISIWDHFYGATGLPDDAQCLESVAMHTALALETRRVQCGSLVYSIGYRHPAVLAKAITAIDLLSEGRAAMGIGAGWAEVEYKAYGIEFPTVGTRMDQLEEGAAALRG